MRSYAEHRICVGMPLTLYHSGIKSTSAISFLRYTQYAIRYTRMVAEEIVLRFLFLTHVPKDIPRRSLIGATLKKLRVEDKEKYTV